MAKLEQAAAEAKNSRVTELETKIQAGEQRLSAGIVMLRKSMVQNFVCLEFNRDLLEML